MVIVVRCHSIFAQMAACREELLTLPDDASLLDALKLVGRQHPALAEALFLAGGTPAPYARPFVNGALPDDLCRPLREGDELALLPVLSGGEQSSQLHPRGVTSRKPSDSAGLKLFAKFLNIKSSWSQVVESVASTPDFDGHSHRIL